MNQTQKSGIIKNPNYNNSISVDKDVCLDVQAGHIEFESMQDVICSLLEQHAMDANDAILHSPLFESYLDMASQAKYNWEHSKDNMIDTVFPNGHDLITSWSLDYDSCTLLYNEVPAGVTKPEEKYTKEVPADVVSNIQKKHMRYDCMESVIRRLVEQHCTDKVDIITPSVVFQSFQQMFSIAKKEFEQTKEQMIDEIFGDDKNEVGSWNLNYSTRLLTY